MTGEEPRVVVMGVSASGKSSVAAALAERCAVAFVDADDLHPEANIAKMAAGIPLEDDDRWPWLESVADALSDRPGGAIVACSALKRRYRDRLRQKVPTLIFVFLNGTPGLLAQRAESRRGHFMPPQLLRSQLEALEPLETDECGITVDIDASVADIAESALEWINARGC